jgi:hypothetical protein
MGFLAEWVRWSEAYAYGMLMACPTPAEWQTLRKTVLVQWSECSDALLRSPAFLERMGQMVCQPVVTMSMSSQQQAEERGRQ